MPRSATTVAASRKRPVNLTLSKILVADCRGWLFVQGGLQDLVSWLPMI